MVSTFDGLQIGERFLFCTLPYGCCKKTGPDRWSGVVDAALTGRAGPAVEVVSVDAPTPNRGRRFCTLAV